jgi:hypothetical protein
MDAKGDSEKAFAIQANSLSTNNDFHKRDCNIALFCAPDPTQSLSK